LDQDGSGKSLMAHFMKTGISNKLANGAIYIRTD
jgi:hypothetical protein